MPIMDGFESTQQIRKILKNKGPPFIHIVAITANVLQKDLEKCLLLGVNDYITKPFRKEELKKENKLLCELSLN